MLDIFLERLRQKNRTVGYPHSRPAVPPRFRGRPFIDAGRCLAVKGEQCGICIQACPCRAVRLKARGPVLDMGSCTFCGHCARACPQEALVFTTDWRLASTEREALLIGPAPYVAGDGSGGIVQSLPERPERSFALTPLPLSATTAAAGTFARSLRLRQVSAAGCGACEADLNVLGTVVFDLGRFGVDFVASPRHADAMAVTGTAPRNMRAAVKKCHEAMAEPRLIIAVGACAISGGLFRDMPEACAPCRKSALHKAEHEPQASGIQPERTAGQSNAGVEALLPVDLYIPGCPPHPYTSLDGLLRFMGSPLLRKSGSI